MIFRFTLLIICSLLFLNSITGQELTAKVNNDKSAEMSNGIISMKFNTKGQATYFALNGKDLLNASNQGRFYFSYNSADYHDLLPTKAELVRKTDELIEIKHTNESNELIIEQSYILLKDVPGAYCYITLKGNAQSVNLREMRVVYRVDKDVFDYAYVSEKREGPMVSPEALTDVEQIMDATYRLNDGSIYTKYDWASYVDDDLLHGLCNNEYGIWVVSSSDEYLNGGPMKQELMVHGTNRTPLALKMLQGEHFGASSQNYTYGDEKIYGPFFIYANSGDNKEAIIVDAKSYAEVEQEKWPYQWMDHKLYPLERTTVSGTLNVAFDISPENMMVVLAEPEKPLYDQGKGYIFWTKADAEGKFTIDNVRPGNYSLYVFATQGEMTDAIEISNIEVTGENTNLGNLRIVPNKYENFLWQIGEADRTARGFKYADQPRTYGLWGVVPANLTYSIGTSKPAENWYYAQTKKGTWNIDFNLDQNYNNQIVYLTVAIAGAASSPSVDVKINNTKVGSLNPGNDGSVYRSANEGGRYQLKSFQFNTSNLRVGKNTLSFTLNNVGNRGGIMYDAIKLEVGDQLSSSKATSQNASSTFNIYPNPSQETATIQVTQTKNKISSLNLIDETGAIIKKIHSGNLPKGLHNFQIDTSDLPIGVYFVNHSNTNSNQIKKLIKY